MGILNICKKLRMRNLLNTISETTASRIKNPFTGAFITSWLVFNWKPLVYIIFSDEKIAEKIKYIESSYSNSWDLLLYPLSSTVIFLFVVPYINLGNEWFIKKSKTDREKRLHEDQILMIERDTRIAEKQAEKEIAVEIVRKQNNKNLEITALQEKIILLEEAAMSERIANDKKEKETNLAINTMLQNIEVSRLENIDLKTKLAEFYSRNDSDKLSFRERINEPEFHIRNFINDRKKDRLPKLLDFNGRLIMEVVDDDNILQYYDPKLKSVIPVKEMFQIFDTADFRVSPKISDLLDVYDQAIANGLNLKPIPKATLKTL